MTLSTTKYVSLFESTILGQYFLNLLSWQGLQTKNNKVRFTCLDW